MRGKAKECRQQRPKPGHTLTSMYCVQAQYGYTILERKKGEHECLLNNNYLLLNIIIVSYSIITQSVDKELILLCKQRVPSLIPITHTKGQT